MIGGHYVFHYTTRAPAFLVAPSDEPFAVNPSCLTPLTPTNED